MVGLSLIQGIPYANRGMDLETLINFVNDLYLRKQQALVQKISTPWKVIRKGKQIISACPEEESTLDYRGTVKGGLSISFDAKETLNPNGLPLSNIKPHQIKYMQVALEMGEHTFIVCSLKSLKKLYYISGSVVVKKYQEWQTHKGKRGYNIIPIEDMEEIIPVAGNPCPYLNYIWRERHEKKNSMDG